MNSAEVCSWRVAFADERAMFRFARDVLLSAKYTTVKVGVIEEETIMSDDCGGCTTEFFRDRLLRCEGLRACRCEGRIGRTTRELELNRRKWVCERSRGRKQRVEITAKIENPPKRKLCGLYKVISML